MADTKTPDGKTLTITTTHNSPAVKKSYKQTFTRK